MNNVTLENARNFAFLADRSYRDVKSTEDKEYKPPFKLGGKYTKELL